MIAQWDSSLSVLPVPRVQFPTTAEYFKGLFLGWAHVLPCTQLKNTKERRGVLLDQSLQSYEYYEMPGAVTTIGCLIIFLILLKIGWKVSTCIMMTPVNSFLNQTAHSIVVIKNPNALYMPIIRWDLLGSCMKILAASDRESDCTIRCTWVLSLHLYRWEQWMYNRSPERDKYMRAC